MCKRMETNTLCDSSAHHDAASWAAGAFILEKTKAGKTEMPKN